MYPQLVKMDYISVKIYADISLILIDRTTYLKLYNSTVTVTV